MENIRNVVVAGPTGTLGHPVIEHLRASDFNLTLLARDLEKTKEQFPELKAFAADYTSIDSLVKTLTAQTGPQDALVVLINRTQLEAQLNVMEAALRAGITHIVPSAFGIGTDHPTVRELPVFDTKVKVEDWVKEQASKGRLTFTGIQTGVFFDWALDKGLYINLLSNGMPTMVFDSGNIPFSGTVVDDVGKAVANALKNAVMLRNRWVFVHSLLVTQNQLLSLAKEVAPEREFKTMQLNTEEMAKQSWEKWNRGERGPAVDRGFMPLVTFGKKSGAFQQTENELLGVEQWDETRLKSFMANYLERHRS